MKDILKIFFVFVLGLAIGGGIAGFFIDKFYKNYLANLSAMELSANAMLARHLREGDAEIY